MQDDRAGRLRRRRTATLVIAGHMIAVPLVALGSRYAGWVPGDRLKGEVLLVLLGSAAGATLSPFLKPFLAYLLCYLLVIFDLGVSLGFLALNQTTHALPYLFVVNVVASMAATLFRLAVLGDLRGRLR